MTPARGDASLIVLSLLPGAPGPVLISAVDTYRIAKERLDVTLTLIGGEVVEGRIFVPAPLLGHSGQLDPAAVFNDRDAFFPLELADGEVLLMCKARIIEVAGLPLADDSDEIRASAPMSLLQITLAGGITHFGSMRLEVRADRPRLLDYLNDCEQTFLTLYTDQGVRLVNRTMIECVRPLD
ncbi:MAG TPA: hypothetical protein VFW04_09850 [Gemmatimonadaceae bacterium]|nr:hypothetical protein [Gemmatimonadaceae bacterium]